MKKRSVIAVLAAALILAGCGSSKTATNADTVDTTEIAVEADTVDTEEAVDDTDVADETNSEEASDTAEESDVTEEAEEHVGSDLEGLPDEFEHYDYKADVRSTYHLDSVETVSDTLVEATYTNEDGRGIIVRKGETPEDAVLGYNVYGSELVVSTENVEEVTLTNYEGMALLATWSANGYSYSILATDFDDLEVNDTGISLKTVGDLVNAVR